MRWQSSILSAVFVVLAADAYAGILYLEVPEDITAEMVRNPSAKDEAVIEDSASIE
jgi:hypothetical protein